MCPKKYSIEIDHEWRIIRYKHSGIIHAEEIEEAWGEFLKIKDFTQDKYNLLSDYRNGKFQIPLSHLPEMIEFMRKIESVVRGRKQALIVDHPYSVAGSIIFMNKVYKEIGFKVKVFSTLPAAIKWLTG
jgi:hypothetical protein